MKHLVLLLVGAAIFAPSVSAQISISQTEACRQRCKDREAELDGPGVLPYNQKLVQLREQKKGETDPAKRKALEAEELRTKNMRASFVGSSCRYICAGK